MKAGDKVFCIKNNVHIKTGLTNHVKNKIYSILKIEENFYSVNGEGGTTSFYNNTFFKYFTPLKEIRKQKLDKLNERR